MTYETPQALRMALEHRLLSQSNDSGVSLDRLRRRVIFERVVSRLQSADPGRWVLKGGMALEVRLRDAARLTKDIDLGLRDSIGAGAELNERLVTALTADPFGDDFVITSEPVTQLMEDSAAHVTWRSKVTAMLGGKLFGRVPAKEPKANDTCSLTYLGRRPNIRGAGVGATAWMVVSKGECPAVVAEHRIQDLPHRHK